jgi:farnesyl-diphosphate farnesyltransferase
LVFYLVLRALDTIEDDTVAFTSVEHKLYYLRDFMDNALHNDKWKMQGVGEADEAHLLENFYRVSKVFQALPQHSQDVISDINKRMGAGMAR